VAEVGERGWTAATIDGIAGRAGVSKPTIYRRWRSKDDLLHFVASRVVEVCDAPDTGDLRRDLLAIFRPMAEHLLDEHLGLARLLPMLVAEATHNAAIRDVVQEAAHQRRRPALDAIDRAVRRGDIPRRTDADAVVDMIAGALIYRLLILGEPIARATVDQVVDQALRGAIRPDRPKKAT